jgi:HSP20 family molecular chaperone IbpA
MKFYGMFPTYNDFRVPMWSDWEYKKNEMILSVAVPGYQKEDFELFVEDKGLFLRIDSEKRKLIYSIYYESDNPKYLLKDTEAEYKNGVLKITIPKDPGKEAKMIPIKVS